MHVLPTHVIISVHNIFNANRYKKLIFAYIAYALRTAVYCTVHSKMICNESAVKQLPSQTESASALRYSLLQSAVNVQMFSKKGGTFLM